MAWLENHIWDMEQGKDALLPLQLFEDQDQTQPWVFTGADVKATVSDDKGRTVFTVLVETNPNQGKINLILSEALVNQLRVGGAYRYDCLLVSPGNTLADDHFIATGPVNVLLRTTRRDE